MPPKTPIRVRIAPSPTGYFHIGSARTALFNWLFARQHGGVFIVRIENTDTERSEKKYDQDILEQLQWLGIAGDEGPITQINADQDADKRGLMTLDLRSNLPTSAYNGEYGPYRQSERGDIYEKYTKKLLDENHAYYCFCSKEELDAMRQNMLTEGAAPKYNGRCRNLSADDVERQMRKGTSSVIRFKTPEIEIAFHDLIRGHVSFDMALAGDMVIAKTPREPLYNFAVVIDDYEMKISHVIRAEDHLANTPKQIIIQKALNLPEVQYAHLPLILNADRSKMSKRFSATAIAEYRQAGYLPEAVVNFVALLGWHPKNEIKNEKEKIKEKEIFSITELIEAFDLNRVQKGGAVFNQEKLDWINSQFIKKLTDEELLERLNGLVKIPDTLSRARVLKVLNAVKDRLKKLTDFIELTDFFFKDPDYPAGRLIWQKTEPKKISDNLKSALEILEKIDVEKFTQAHLTEVLKPLTEPEGRGAVLWPIRVALSGKEASPGPFEIMEILGKNETTARIKSAIGKLAENH